MVKRQYNFYVLLFLDSESESKIHDFFKSHYNIPQKSLVKNLHLTLYYSRRTMIGLDQRFRKDSDVMIDVDVQETRFMTMTPGGENPKEGIIPSKTSIGIRLTKRNNSIKEIMSLRRIYYEIEPNFKTRTKTKDWYNSFGSNHYQPHIKILHPKNKLTVDLSEVGIDFRSQIKQLRFNRLKVRDRVTSVKFK